MDSSKKHLRKIAGVDNSPLVYLICDTATIPVTTDGLLPGKCYSLTYKSLTEEIVARKSHNSTCVETDKVTLFGLLEKALKGRPLESALQPHEDSKDGQVVIKSMYVQYEGRTKWGRAHTSKTTQLTIKWNSANGTKTLTNHIANFRVAMVDIIR